MMKFYAEIELENETMQTPQEVRDALIHSLYVRGDVYDSWGDGATKRIYDINGNDVGSWRMEKDGDSC